MLFLVVVLEEHFIDLFLSGPAVNGRLLLLFLLRIVQQDLVCLRLLDLPLKLG